MSTSVAPANPLIQADAHKQTFSDKITADLERVLQIAPPGLTLVEYWELLVAEADLPRDLFAAVLAVVGGDDLAGMVARYEVHITRTPLGLGIHEDDTLVKVSGALTGDEVITQGVRSGDILLKVSTSIFTDAPCTRLVGLRVVFDYGRVWGSLPPMSLKHPFSLTCGSWLKSWHNTIPLPHTRLSRCH